MQIAIFDYLVVPSNAIGNCDRHILAGLSKEHTFTVFAVECDNPDPERITFVRVPVPKRPLFLLFVAYHLVAPIVYWLYKLRHHVSFDVVQTIESNSLHGTLVYSHFCHRAYLRDHWQQTRPSGMRGLARWLDHLFHSLLEPLVYRRARQIVVPSNGLKRELGSVFGANLSDKIQVISNPIRVGRMQRPADFDRQALRDEMGFSSPDDLVLVFVALGHYERKGLPLLLEAIEKVQDRRVKLAVLGGAADLIEKYRRRVEAMGMADQVKFAGFLPDIRTHLWAADVFAFPSAYETFSLVSVEAAAAGLPLLVSPLYGVEDWLVDGENGWCVERNASAIAEKIRFALENAGELAEMGQRAAEAVKIFDGDGFVSSWRTFYAGLS